MRVVSLLPSATEILFAIGAGERVVGVTHECDFPPEARLKPQLTASSLPPSRDPAVIDRHVRANLHNGSSIYSLDAALLEQLAPDLIVTQELCPVCAVSYDTVSAATKRVRSDPRVVSLEPSSLEDVYATIESVAALVGAQDAAAQLLDHLRMRELRLREITATVDRCTTVVLEWTDPAMSGGHWTPGLVELAGGTPLLAHPGRDSQRLEWTAIAGADPEAVIIAPCGFDLETSVRAAQALDRVPEWKALRAVRAGRVAVVDGNAYVNRPGPRLLDSAEIFAAALHPELAAAIPDHRAGWTMLPA